MATRQTSRPSKIAAGTWSKIFPATVDKREQSLMFVQKLLAVGISNVLYLRATYPESAFVTKNLDGLPIKILNGKSEDCPEARALCQMVQAASEAIEKKYLRELILAVYLDPEKPEEAVETYTFHFSYEGTGGDSINITFGEVEGSSSTTGLKDKDDLYKRTVLIIRQIIQVTQGLPMLPDEAYITLKLTYYDEVTPEEYEPEGFVKSEIDFKCDEDVEPIVTPAVKTKFHGFHIKIRSRDIQDVNISSVARPLLAGDSSNIIAATPVMETKGSKWNKNIRM